MHPETTTTFLDDLLADVEQKETQNIQAYHDLIAMEVIKLESEISSVFKQAEVECSIINDWALRKNSAIQERANLLKMKLEAFIRAEGKKTIDLPHGTLKLRKSPDKVEIADMEVFLANANSQMVTVVPETVKPDLAKIKAFIKMTTKVPQGVNLIEGAEKFSLVLRSSNSTEEE